MSNGLLILAAIALLAVFWSVGAVKRLDRLRAACREKFAQAYGQSRYRYDLLPSLVETVRGYMKDERTIFEAVIESVNQALAAHARVAGNMHDVRAVGELRTAEQALDLALAAMFARAEACAPLQADPNMRQAMQELNAAEGRIGFSRQVYDDAEAAYNGARRQFPASVIAFLFGFKAAGVLRK
ncbi:MAG TPA: LemA family protein [Noviherbaspirillum sp.]|jgi:LemA protein